jgi:hypothetical protein
MRLKFNYMLFQRFIASNTRPLIKKSTRAISVAFDYQFEKKVERCNLHDDRLNNFMRVLDMEVDTQSADFIENYD